MKLICEISIKSRSSDVNGTYGAKTPVKARVGIASGVRRLIPALILVIGVTGCLSMLEPVSLHSEPVALWLTVQQDAKVLARYELREPVTSLYYQRELDGYRAEVWVPSDPVFRWVAVGEGERLERNDGQPFDTVELIIPVDYRSLPKTYAPFSPFSEGSALIHSGQFHVCLSGPCETPVPLPMVISAADLTIGAEGERQLHHMHFTSRGNGTKIFVGTLQPVNAEGFIAVIDPGLPTDVRARLSWSLPEAVDFFSGIYGPLSFTPELYVSIDDRPESRGRISTQGGTLPNQIFMHFDGEGAKRRVSEGSSLGLDWFFAHEAAHLFQQDAVGQERKAFDITAAWIHEGGAEAMAALALVHRGSEEHAYTTKRQQQALDSCAEGLEKTSLSRASADGLFDLHYQCGLLLWLALDEQLYQSGNGGLHNLNRHFFKHVRTGEGWSDTLFLRAASELDAGSELLSVIGDLSNGNYEDPAVKLQLVGLWAKQSLDRHAMNGQDDEQ